MLCQSILQMSDDDIIEEYAKSECMREEGCTNTNAITVKGRFDRQRFAGSPPHVMAETLTFVRRKYGSVCPGYLDAIGFGKSWRDRFWACQKNVPPHAASSLPSKL
jgi:Tyrosine phosphatase family